MPAKDSMIVIDAEDPDITAKVKNLKKRDWRFLEKKGNKIYYERYKDPLYKIDFSILVLFAFVAFFTSVLIMGLALF